MRQPDRNLAKRYLNWLNLDPEDENLLDLLTKDTSPLIGDETPVHRRGEGLLRDARGNVARVKVLLPQDKRRRRAIELAGNAATRAISEGVA